MPPLSSSARPQQQKGNHTIINNKVLQNGVAADPGKDGRRDSPRTRRTLALKPPHPQRADLRPKGIESASRQGQQQQRQQQHRRQIPTISKATPTRISPRGMTLMGASLLAFSTYCGYLWATYEKDVAKSQSLQVPDDMSHRFNEIAQEYDSEVELGERVMRLSARRKELVCMARGDVLEVSCGTGRNMAYYQLGERRGINEKSGRGEIQGCRSVTFVDLSPEMVDIARRKFGRLFPSMTDSDLGKGRGFSRVAFSAISARELSPPFAFKSEFFGDSSSASQSAPVAFRSNMSVGMVGSPSFGTGAGDASESIVDMESTAADSTWSTSKPEYFDTVLQTMGLCSTPDPVGMLQHLGNITEPEHGRILLLEHGRSYYHWLNAILDKLAAAHAARYGCWWNRDIEQIVEQSGLEVVDIQRYHLGTTWRVILRPKKSKPLGTGLGGQQEALR